MKKNTPPKIRNRQSLRVLIVEDSEDDALLIIRDLKKGGYNPVYERVETAAAMKKALQEKQWDIILCDYSLPKFNAPSAIEVLKKANIDIPLIIVSGAIGEETAVECMLSGAQDYIIKDNLSRLCPAIARELKEAEVKSQREAALEALRQSEEKYRSIIENIQDGYVEVDLVGNWTFVNNVICRHMGYSREELIGTDFHKLHTKRSAKRSVKAFAEVYKTGEPLKSLEVEGVRKDGTIGNYELSVSLMKDANGQPTRFSCISRDITECKRMEEEIRQSEERYRTILDEMENGYFEVDLAGNYTFINDTNCRQLGYSKEEMIGLNFRVPMVKESIEIVSNAFKNIYITGKPQRGISYKAMRKDGTTGFAEISGFPLKNKKEEIIGFRGMALNITERKRAEETLRRSEEKYRSIIENMQEPYWENDLEGNLTFVNDALCKYLGYSREELIGKKIYRENKEAAKKSFEAYNRIYRTGEPIRGFEETYTRKDGIKGFAEISASLIRDAEGKPIGFRCFSHDITERKQAEEQLRRSEERYRTIIESIEDGYFEIDLGGNFTFVNDAECRIVGTPREQLLGRNNRSYTSKEEAKKLYQLFSGLYITGEPIQGFAFEYKRSDGTVAFNEMSASLIKDAEGKPIGFRGISRDVTERKLAEGALRQSEEKYRTFIETINDGYYEIDLTGKYTFVNDMICKHLQYSKEELIGMSNRQYQTKANAKKAFQAFTEVLMTGNPIKAMEMEVIRKDGTIQISEVSVSLIRNAEGNPILFRGISRDITERKQMEETLHQSEEKYRTILETIQEGYFELDIAGNFTFVNNAECKILGYSLEELIGMNYKQFSDEKNAKALYHFFVGIYKTGIPVKVYYLDVELIKKGGTKVFHEISGSLLKNAQGEAIGFRGISRDITERKKVDAELQRTLDNLRKSFGTTIQVMVSAVEMRDPYTAGHQTRVADIARAIATEMGLPRDQIDGIRLAGTIHDIGKLSIPAEILAKPTKLTAIEFSLIKEHSRIGYEMLKDMESPWPLAQIVYQHHERMNGSGYPRNLKGDEILMEARIMAVADVVEAMASHRPYRPGLGIETALEEIERNKGIFYDNVVADACVRLFREKNYKIP